MQPLGASDAPGTAHRPTFALVVDGDAIAPWHADCLSLLTKVAALDTIVIAPLSEATARPGRFTRKMLATSRISRTISLDTYLPGVRLLHSQQPLEALELRNIDFALALGNPAFSPRRNALPPRGLWTYLHELESASLPFLTEVEDGCDVTHATLVSLHPSGERLILEQGWYRTEQRSYTRQLASILPSVARWPARAAARLGFASRESLLTIQTVEGSSVPRRTPSPARYMLNVARRRFSFALDRVVRHQQWNVGLVRRRAGDLVEEGALPERDIEWFPLRGRKRFIADPIGIRRDDTLYVFYEEFSYREGRGRVVANSWPEAGKRPVEALRLPVHVSYPFLVEDAGRLYCIPETAQAREVALYEAVQFPSAWKKVAILLQEFPGVDPTVVWYEDRWWLFCTEAGRDEEAALWIWHATDLRGPWIPHRRNPVKTDIRGARPGGVPFFHDGALYRPTQDCSRHYGWRVAIQRINVLTPTQFDEEPVAIFEAPRGSRFPLGRHTFSPVGDVVFIDGHRRVFVWAAFAAFVHTASRDLLRRLRVHGA